MRHAALTVILAALLPSGCVTTQPRNAADQDVKIDKVFFAQHHVLEPTNELFKLVGDLEALIKVQVYSDTPTQSPYVFAELELDGETETLRLRGPAMLPKKPDVDPVLFDHSYDDSFTAMIPKSWIKSGLKVAVELREHNYLDEDGDDNQHTNNTTRDNIIVLDSQVIDDLKVGAPTRVVMQSFDIHYFGKGKGADMPEGWERELEAKLPVSELVVHRVKALMFNEIVMPPMFEKPSARYTSLEDFKERTGKEFDGEQGIALKWCSALKAAGGSFGLWRPYNIYIGGVYSGGQAGGYRSCANLHRHGVIIHELGHTFGLPHWAHNRDYPYKRTMYGNDQGEPTKPNAGPTWAFDVGTREFLRPYDLVDGKMVWKKDPMHGGGRSNMKNHMFKHFSDYSIHKMQQRFEDRAVYWNEELGKYAKWNQETASYDQIVENSGVLLPIERDVEVISLLASANVAVPDANIIYPPIGPYTACLITRFDAESEKDRKKASELGYSASRCNVALRVTQGGKTKSYLMRAKVSPTDDPMRAFAAAAINLPARDGAITKAELLYCPDLIEKGITDEHKVLYTWKKE